MLNSPLPSAYFPPFSSGLGGLGKDAHRQGLLHFRAVGLADRDLQGLGELQDLNSSSLEFESWIS